MLTVVVVPPEQPGVVAFGAGEPAGQFRARHRLLQPADGGSADLSGQGVAGQHGPVGPVGFAQLA